MNAREAFGIALCMSQQNMSQQIDPRGVDMKAFKKHEINVVELQNQTLRMSFGLPPSEVDPCKNAIALSQVGIQASALPNASPQ